MFININFHFYVHNVISLHQEIILFFLIYSLLGKSIVGIVSKIKYVMDLIIIIIINKLPKNIYLINILLDIRISIN